MNRRALLLSALAAPFVPMRTNPFAVEPRNLSVSMDGMHIRDGRVIVYQATHPLPAYSDVWTVSGSGGIEEVIRLHRPIAAGEEFRVRITGQA